MIIRPATATDHDAIWTLLHDVFRAGETYAVDPAITKADALDYWVKASAATYVAEADGRIVGTYYIKTNQPGGGAHICNCGYIVSPAARGQGLARQMCEASQERARAMGYRAMQFNFVLSSNAGAVRLWHKLGFTTVGTIPDAFDHPKVGMVDAYVMHKALAG
ncbi:GNAT family N-acetyltransferase [Yoonia sediminilitoris]|uniref:Ribosomal protein S18 acetylase RimI-like enzyme n=1 Tax=Yoonia sediminilitoris TaxID=1286148 RepID=A0A2T6KEP6_9RHOB|nr:N-acetyltransferase [Yoonia sediminilitoris]PUB13593.1 ribosomal protein S18 acetylase RimI-like enzyme [Yoonia sediminilitoris]RCW94763.1 ribosomal protein S18 acetylase RimI-like enzyme [Yoonia sediminilitoris]